MRCWQQRRHGAGRFTLRALALLAAGCAASTRDPSLPTEGGAAAVYEKTVLVRGALLSGGIAVVSRSDGDSVFVVGAAGLEEYDGATGAPRRVLDGSRNPALAGVRNLSASGSRLILSAAAENRVQVLDLAGDPVIEEHRGFAVPINAIFYRDDLLVAEQRGGSIARRRADTVATDVWVTGMRSPAGLAATATDLWVTDRASGTILQLVSNGVRLPEPVEIAAGLSRPEGLAVTPHRSLVVVETGAQRLASVDLRTRRLRVIDDQLPVGSVPGDDASMIGRFGGVGVGRCGTIYVAADLTGEILRYTPKDRGCP
jgi:hypothetical protein